MATEMARAMEAIIMVADGPVDPQLLAQLLERDVTEVEGVLRELMASYEVEDRGFILTKVAGGYRYQSHPDLAGYVERFVLEGQSARLSAAALETLAIVAYKQPISRGQVAAIRGVNVDGVVRTLEQRGYIMEVGRDPGPGNPSLFGTTTVFLEKMGINSLDDLPPIAEFVPGPDIVEQLEHGLRAEIDGDVAAEVGADAGDGPLAEAAPVAPPARDRDEPVESAGDPAPAPDEPVEQEPAPDAGPDGDEPVETIAPVEDGDDDAPAADAVAEAASHVEDETVEPAAGGAPSDHDDAGAHEAALPAPVTDPPAVSAGPSSADVSEEVRRPGVDEPDGGGEAAPASLTIAQSDPAGHLGAEPSDLAEGSAASELPAPRDEPSADDQASPDQSPEEGQAALSPSDPTAQPGSSAPGAAEPTTASASTTPAEHPDRSSADRGSPMAPEAAPSEEVAPRRDPFRIGIETSIGAGPATSPPGVGGVSTGPAPVGRGGSGSGDAGGGRGAEPKPHGWSPAPAGPSGPSVPPFAEGRPGAPVDHRRAGAPGRSKADDADADAVERGRSDLDAAAAPGLPHGVQAGTGPLGATPARRDQVVDGPVGDDAVVVDRPSAGDPDQSGGEPRRDGPDGIGTGPGAPSGTAPHVVEPPRGPADGPVRDGDGAA